MVFCRKDAPLGQSAPSRFSIHTPSVSLRSTAPPRGRLWAMPGTLPSPRKPSPWTDSPRPGRDVASATEWGTGGIAAGDDGRGIPPQRRTFAESGTANAVFLHDPTRENGTPERPQTLRCSEIINIFFLDFCAKRTRSAFQIIYYRPRPPPPPWLEPPPMPPKPPPKLPPPKPPRPAPPPKEPPPMPPKPPPRGGRGPREPP